MFDEPYHASNCTITEIGILIKNKITKNYSISCAFFDYLENAITLVKKVFPDQFSYITFAHHCFDPTSNDIACNTPSSQRGIPKNLDWIGFDWYLHFKDALGLFIFSYLKPKKMNEF